MLQIYLFDHLSYEIIYGKNGFAKVFKNLAKYKSEK